MAKTIKKGKDVAGNVVEVTAARFVPSNAKNLQSTLKICLDRSAKTEEQKRQDVASIALLALPAIEEFREDLGAIPSPQQVKNMLEFAGGVSTLKSDEPGYKTFMRRFNAGVQSALTAHLSDAHRLAPDNIKKNGDKVANGEKVSLRDLAVIIGELEAHQNQLVPTFNWVVTNEDGKRAVIDPKAENTLEKNPHAEDWTLVRGVKSIATQAEKVGAKDATKKGPDKRNNSNPAKDQNPDLIDVFTLRDFVTGRSTGTPANVENLRKDELRVVLASLEISEATVSKCGGDTTPIKDAIKMVKVSLENATVDVAAVA